MKHVVLIKVLNSANKIIELSRNMIIWYYLSCTINVCTTSVFSTVSSTK